MTKMPDEIKRGLECCASVDGCDKCPYYDDGMPQCIDAHADALAYIHELEAANGTTLHGSRCDCEVVRMREFSAMVICGFPGVGKSAAANNRTNIEDAESSVFSWVFDPNMPKKPRERNPDFPGNYGAHIEKLAGRLGYDIVLVSCHRVVRDELDRRGIDYVIVVPDKSLKDEYLMRYIKRGSNAEFVNLVAQKWEEWLDEIEHNGEHAVIHLGSGEYLSDILPR